MVGHFCKLLETIIILLQLQLCVQINDGSLMQKEFNMQQSYLIILL